MYICTMQKGIKYLRHKPVLIYLSSCISVILLFIFLFDLGGYYVWFCIWQNNMQKEIRKEIRKGLKDEDLTLIIISVDEESGISWIEQNKEFRYQGDMYDVVKISQQNQEKYYYCIRDIKEKQLIASYNKNNHSRSESGKRIKQFKYQYIPQNNSPADLVYPVAFAITEIPANYKSNITEINSPPPKMH
jgi:hypothetical protein